MHLSWSVLQSADDSIRVKAFKEEEVQASSRHKKDLLSTEADMSCREVNSDCYEKSSWWATYSIYKRNVIMSTNEFTE